MKNLQYRFISILIAAFMLFGANYSAQAQIVDAQVDFDTTLEDQFKIIEPYFNDILQGPCAVNFVITIIDSTLHGTVQVLNREQFIYTPDENFGGDDSVFYKICCFDGSANCDSNYHHIHVINVNDPPTIVADTVYIFEDVNIDSTDVGGNDSDPEGDDIIYRVVKVTSGGTASMIGGKLQYNPPADYFGFDTVCIEACDDASPPFCDTGLAIIELNPVDDAPRAQIDNAITDQEEEICFDVINNDIEVDGDDIQLVAVTNGSNGNAIVQNTTTVCYTPNNGFIGLDTVEYRVCDVAGAMLCDTGLFIIDVQDINDKPVAVDDNFSIDEDICTVFDVQLNDSDQDLDVLTTTIIDFPNNGNIDQVVNNDSVKYTPAENFNGTDTFVYVICDNDPVVNLCDTAAVFIQVLPVNDRPVAADDAATTPEEQAVLIDVQLNDEDVEDVDLQTKKISDPSNGQITVITLDQIEYTPNDDFTGNDTFFYAVCDRNAPAGIDTARVIVTVTPVNDKPVAQNDNATTDEDVRVCIPLLDNDSDIDGDNLLFNVLNGTPSNGNLDIDGDSLCYTPTLNFSGLDTIDYRVCDQGGLCDSAQIFITINPVNDAPVAVNDQVSMLEDTDSVFIVLNNDTDAENDPLIMFIVENADSGTSVAQNFITVAYVPNPNFTGLDTVIYRVCDQNFDQKCDTALLIINVLPVNDKPVAVNDVETTNEDEAVAVYIEANDSDIDGDDISALIIVNSNNGTATVVGDSVIYTPAEDFNGVDTFTYRLCDNGTPRLCDTAIAIITVNPVNDAPNAVNDEVNVNEDETICFEPLSNDSDPEMDVIIPQIIENGSLGAAQFTVNDTLCYTPQPNVNGKDTIRYQICDGGAPSLCDTAIICINILPVDDAPIASNDSAITNEDEVIVIDVQINDTDLDDTLLTTALCSDPLFAQGTVEILNGDSIQYTPNLDFFGSDTLCYVVCDGTSCDSALLIITINPVNDAPIANDDEANLLQADSVTIGILGNDFDVDSDSLITKIIELPTEGTAVLISNDSIQYFSPQNYRGTDTIVYAICDTNNPALADTAIVVITVRDFNEKPTARDDNFTIPEDSVVCLEVLANDSDFEDAKLQIQILEQVENGNLTVNDSCILLDPALNYNGNLSFQYIICDTGGLCDTATVQLTITPVNDPVVAVNDCDSTAPQESITVDVLLNDQNPDNETLTVEIDVQPSFGELVSISSGEVEYVPNVDARGKIDSIPYVLCDLEDCDTALLIIKIVGPLPAPSKVLPKPNAFTPNGDNVNDNFVIEGIENYPNNTLKIYNRWGDLIIDIKGFNNNWNSITQDSWRLLGGDQPLPNGVYFYILTFDDYDDVITGDLTIIY